VKAQVTEYARRFRGNADRVRQGEGRKSAVSFPVKAWKGDACTRRRVKILKKGGNQNLEEGGWKKPFEISFLGPNPHTKGND